MNKKTISIIGLGYIGLPTAAVLASKGYMVLGVDINKKIVDTINQGDIHIVEPELRELVHAAVAAGNLKAFVSPQKADIYMICVPTPFHENEGIPKPNMDFAITAMRSIAPLLKSRDMVIIESTSPVGTTEMMQDVLRMMGVNVDDLDIAYCPERVLPGRTIAELIENDRVVGGLSTKSTKSIAKFYRTFVRGAVLESDSKTAEMCKLTENSFRDVNIAFANELSIICDSEGINVWNLIELANRHPRVNILQPSVGVGGHCIAVDPWFIVARNTENTKIIRKAREVNNYKTDWVVDRIKVAIADFLGKSKKKPIIACLGLAFKPDIDDLRESPAMQVAIKLKSQGFEVLAVEPNIKEHVNVTVVSIEQAFIQADIIAVLVKHKEFLNISLKRRFVAQSVLDFCGVLHES